MGLAEPLGPASRQENWRGFCYSSRLQSWSWMGLNRVGFTMGLGNTLQKTPQSTTQPCKSDVEVSQAASETQAHTI